MNKFPVDAPLERVLRALERLGFILVRRGIHLCTPLTLPGHRTIKGFTLRTVLTQSGISRAEFLTVYEKA